MAIYECTGSVSLSGSSKQATCSVAWSLYTPPATTPTTQNATLELSGQLITAEQAHDLAQALILLFVTIAVYRALARAF